MTLAASFKAFIGRNKKFALASPAQGLRMGVGSGQPLGGGNSAPPESFRSTPMGAGIPQGTGFIIGVSHIGHTV